MLYDLILCNWSGVSSLIHPSSHLLTLNLSLISREGHRTGPQPITNTYTYLTLTVTHTCNQHACFWQDCMKKPENVREKTHPPKRCRPHIERSFWLGAIHQTAMHPLIITVSVPQVTSLVCSVLTSVDKPKLVCSGGDVTTLPGYVQWSLETVRQNILAITACYREVAKTEREREREKAWILWIICFTVHEKPQCSMFLLCHLKKPQWNSLYCSFV